MKDDSISFSFEASVKGQALGDPLKFKESEKIKWLLRNARQRVYQITMNFNIHLGFKMKEKSTKDLTYVQEISLNAVPGVSQV